MGGVWVVRGKGKLIYGTTEGKETRDGTRSDSRRSGYRAGRVGGRRATRGAGGRVGVKWRWRGGTGREVMGIRRQVVRSGRRQEVWWQGGIAGAEENSDVGESKVEDGEV